MAKDVVKRAQIGRHLLDRNVPQLGILETDTPESWRGPRPPAASLQVNAEAASRRFIAI